MEGISRTRWEDFTNLSRKGWRENSLAVQPGTFLALRAVFRGVAGKRLSYNG